MQNRHSAKAMKLFCRLETASPQVGSSDIVSMQTSDYPKWKAEWHRVTMRVDRVRQICGAQWAKYKENEHKLEPQFERDSAELRINWDLAAIGILPQSEWKIIRDEFLNKWGEYKIWLQYKIYLGWKKRTKYAMALDQFGADEADLWRKYMYKRLETEEMNHLDKMSASRVDAKVRAMFCEQWKTPKLPPSQPQKEIDQKDNSDSVEMQEQQEMGEAARDAASAEERPKTQQSQEQQAPPTTEQVASKEKEDVVVPSTGDRLQDAMEADERKRERGERRLARLKRRGLQKLRPSKQQIENERMA